MIGYLSVFRHTAAYLSLLLSTAVFCNCSVYEFSDTEIESNAKKYNSHCSLTTIIEGYSLVYYSMPLSKKELLQYWCLYREKERGDDFRQWFQSEFQGYTPNRFLRKKHVYYSAYEDSCFIFDAKNKFGCCVYGTPAFWANTDPWKYREKGNIYSFLDFKSRPIDFEMHDSLTNVVRNDLKIIRSKYDKLLICEIDLNRLDEKYTSQASNAFWQPPLIPFRVAFHYSRQKGLEYSFKNGVDPQFQEYSETTKSFKPITDLSIHCCLNQGILEDYALYFNNFLDSNPNIKDIFFLSPVVYIQSASDRNP